MIKKIWEKVIRLSRGTKYHKYFFPSFWHPLLFSTHNKFQSVNNPVNFLTAIPNRGAGIGHQMSNYHSGIWYAVFFKMKHVC